MTEKPIATFVINLKKRTDRKTHILAEFVGKGEFAVTIIEAFEHEIGVVGRWNSIVDILENCIKETDSYILICEDDHQFTKKYSKQLLYRCIDEAIKAGADVLAGGVNRFGPAVNIANNLYWVDDFGGSQFLIIFKSFFKTLIAAARDTNWAANNNITSLIKNALMIYPFISTQKDFGYSDITVAKQKKRAVSSSFHAASRRFSKFQKLEKYYQELQGCIEIENTAEDFEEFTLPTYIINLPERTERLEHILNQFKDKPEFDVTVVRACKHSIGAYGLWLSIRKVIAIAIANDDDVIVISEDDHAFTEYYSREFLLRNVLQAHAQGADYLSGGTGRFSHVIPITANRYWVNHCLSTQFVVLYKKFFKQILDEPFDETVIADLLYSDMTSNKMVLFPFISVQRDFGYSDITDLHNANKNLVTSMFANSAARLGQIQKVYLQQKDDKYNYKRA